MVKKTNVLNLPKIKKKRYQLTDAKIKNLPTRTSKLSNWKEETFLSDKYDGLGIRRRPRGKNNGNIPQSKSKRLLIGIKIKKL